MQTEINPLPKQEKFLALKATHNLLVSGYGFGKTETKLIALLMDMVAYGKYGAVFALYDPTHDLLTVNTIPRLLEKLELAGIEFKYNQQKKIIKTDNYGTIFLRSMDAPNRIVAYECFRSFIDELETLRPKQIIDVWNKINGRNRQKLVGCEQAKNRTYTFTTPDAGFGFTYNTWGKSKDKDQFDYVNASTEDNPHLPDDYVKNLRKIYPEGMVKAFIHGQWTNIAQGVVYTEFNRVSCHDIIKVNSHDSLDIGQDFNSGGCISIIAKFHNGVVYVVDEMVSQSTYDIYPNYSSLYANKATIYPDASGNSKSSNATDTDIQILNENFYTDYRKINPMIRNRVLTVNVALKNNLLKIDVDKCPKLVEALETQAYDDSGKPEKSNGSATKDDYVDALGYMIYNLLPIKSVVQTTVYNNHNIF